MKLFEMPTITDYRVAIFAEFDDGTPSPWDNTQDFDLNTNNAATPNWIPAFNPTVTDFNMPYGITMTDYFLVCEQSVCTKYNFDGTTAPGPPMVENRIQAAYAVVSPGVLFAIGGLDPGEDLLQFLEASLWLFSFQTCTELCK